MYSLWKVWLLRILSIYLTIFSRFEFVISFLSCYEGNSLAFFMRLFKKLFYSSSIFYCYCFNYIWSCAFLTFLLLLCCELYCLLLESWPPLVSFAILLRLIVEVWAKPVTFWLWVFPVFFVLLFLSSLSFATYSAAPGTSYLECISIASLSRGRQLKGFSKKLLNSLSTFLRMSSPKI